MKLGRMVMLLVAVPAVLLTIGSAGAMQQSPPKASLIRYKTSGCYGPCPSYTVTVGSNGLALFEGHSDTAVKGKRQFRVDARQFRAFGWALQKYMYKQGGAPGSASCQLVHTDDISVSVTWTMRNGKSHTLNHYFGCDDPGTAALEKELVAAPKLLPIKAFVGGKF